MLRKKKTYEHTAVCFTANVFSINDCLEHLCTAEAGESRTGGFQKKFQQIFLAVEERHLL